MQRDTTKMQSSKSRYRALYSPSPLSGGSDDFSPSKFQRLISTSPPLASDTPPAWVDTLDRIMLCAAKIYAILVTNPASQHVASDELRAVAKGMATKFVLTLHSQSLFDNANIEFFVRSMYPPNRGWLEAVVMRVTDFRYVCDDVRIDQASSLPLEMRDRHRFLEALRTRTVDTHTRPPPGAAVAMMVPRPVDDKLGFLGQGTYGKVYLVRRPSYLGDELPLLLARKTIRRAFDLDKGADRTVLRELFLQRDLAHPNVASILHVSMSAVDPFGPMRALDIYIYMHRMTDLRTILRNEARPLDPIQLRASTRHALRNICEGVAYIHSQGVIHRDLKPANILRTTEGVLQLADFGLARYGDESGADGQHSLSVQTLWYRSPEILFGARRYTRAVDMWSVGCIAYEIATGNPWFPGANEVDQQGRILDRIGVPPQGSEIRALPEFAPFVSATQPRPTPLFKTRMLPEDDLAFVALVSGLVTYNPHTRLTATDALLTPFLRDS